MIGSANPPEVFIVEKYDLGLNRVSFDSLMTALMLNVEVSLILNRFKG
jgi:hypothetical protein